MPSKTVVFDCVGTLFSYTRIFTAIDTHLGPRLTPYNITGTHLGYTWLEVAERESFFLGISGRRVPFIKVFRAMFYRVLLCAGVPNPQSLFTDADFEKVMDEYMHLEARPGAKECVEMLREAGFKVYGYTTGELKRVRGYFDGAGIEMQEGDLLTCDDKDVCKPMPEAYAPILDKLDKEGDKEPWFAAAHMWDVSAARRSG